MERQAGKASFSEAAAPQNLFCIRETSDIRYTRSVNGCFRVRAEVRLRVSAYL